METGENRTFPPVSTWTMSAAAMFASLHYKETEAKPFDSASEALRFTCSFGFYPNY